MSILKGYFSDVEWFVAIKKHSEEPIEEQNMSFYVLKNSWRYWCADPFLFESDGKTYIFMEVFDRLTQMGYIGYRTIENNRISGIKLCIKEKHHMSYPFVFRHKGGIYIMPECYQSGQVTLYRASRFPDKWEKAEVLIHDKMLCDTNILEHNGETYLFTTEIHGIPFEYDELLMYSLEHGHFEECEINPVVKGAEHSRNGGGVFLNAGRLLRTAQNCAGTYGDSICFRQIEELAKDKYSESDLCTLAIDKVTAVNSSKRFDGIHTFNVGTKYDAVDLRIEKSVQPVRILYLIRNKILNVFFR